MLCALSPPQVFSFDCGSRKLAKEVVLVAPNARDPVLRIR